MRESEGIEKRLAHWRQTAVCHVLAFVVSPPASPEYPAPTLANPTPIEQGMTCRILGNVLRVAETLTVRELCTAVSAAVEEALPDEVWVKGVISGLKRSANGHVYFDLVEPNGTPGSSTAELVPVALFAANRHRVNHILRKSGAIRMTDGLEIRIRGKVAFYPPQGRVQLVMSLIDPAHTMGQMALARQVLIDTLRAEGLLHANHVHELPALPLRIGLVTSDQSAAHADFVHELEVSGFPFSVQLFDSRVQGIDAVPSLVQGIDEAGKADVDIVVVIRGGGARSDLVAFDHERVARAIARCPLPVVVGVGHEIDRSVADEVAHTSAKTPTATAAVLVDAVRQFEAAVEEATDRLATVTTTQLDEASARQAGTGHRLVVAAAMATNHHATWLETSVAQLEERSRRALERASAHLDGIEVRLRALDPAAALSRGWSITHTEDGTLVRRADQVVPGTTVISTTGSGRLVSTVTEVSNDE